MAQADLVSNEHEIQAVQTALTYAVSSGTVVPVANGTRIAQRPAAANELSALGIGGGVYDVDKVSGVNRAVTDDMKLYWDQSVSGAVSVASGNKLLGLAVEAVGVSDTKVRIAHIPGAP